MKLSTKARKALPAKTFAGPGRSFPINDKSHARAAISGATRSERAGNISVATADKVKAKARAKLEGRGGNHEPKGNSQHYGRGSTPTHEVSTHKHFEKL